MTKDNLRDQIKVVTDQATKEAYQSGAASGAISASESIEAIGKSNDNVISEAEKASNEATQVVFDRYKLEIYTEEVENYFNESFNVDSDVTCPTSQGTMIYGGETVLGDPVDESVGWYEVLSCTANGWREVPGCKVNGHGKDACQVTILPSYYLAPGHANCYEDNYLIGDQSIVGANSSNPRQCINGSLVTYIPDIVPQDAQDTESDQDEGSDSRDRGRSRINRPDTPPTSTPNSFASSRSDVVSSAALPTNKPAVVGSVPSTRESCSISNGRWSDLLGECILSEYPVYSPSPLPSLASVPPQSYTDIYGDPEARRACERLKGNFLPETNSCLSTFVSRSNTKTTKDSPLQISSDIDLDDLNLKGTLGATAAQIAEITGQCQLAGNGSGQALYDCMCDSIECSPGSAAEQIATYLKNNSTDQLGLQCVEYATIIISAVGDGSSPICGVDQAKDINKSCLPKNESNGWYYCENPTELYADDVGIFAGSGAIGDPGHIGLCADGDGSSTCSFADVNYRVDNQALVHPVAASEMTAVFRKLPDGHPASKGCWASQNNYIN